MSGFKTNTGTKYYLDTVNMLFSGGKYKNPVKYLSAYCMIGMAGVIYLADGRVVTTNIIQCYL